MGFARVVEGGRVDARDSGRRACRLPRAARPPKGGHIGARASRTQYQLFVRKVFFVQKARSVGRGSMSLAAWAHEPPTGRLDDGSKSHNRPESNRFGGDKRAAQRHDPREAAHCQEQEPRGLWRTLADTGGRGGWVGINNPRSDRCSRWLRPRNTPSLRPRSRASLVGAVAGWVRVGDLRQRAGWVGGEKKPAERPLTCPPVAAAARHGWAGGKRRAAAAEGGHKDLVITRAYTRPRQKSDKTSINKGV